MAELYVLPEMVLEVLLRVPAAYICRLRRVSPLWRDIIDSSFFREAHRRRRSPMLLLFSRTDFLDLSAIELHEFDADEREPRRLLRFAPVQTPPAMHLRFPGLQAFDATPDSLLKVEGCCSGVVLVSSADALYACNPCTRRWSRLPPVHLHRSIAALYPVGADLRVIFSDGIGGYCVMDLGSHLIRDIGTPTLARSPPGLEIVVRDGLRQDTYDDPPLHIDGRLFWRPQLDDQELKCIVVFDTDETFMWMDPPSVKLGKTSRTVDVDVLFQMRERPAAATIDTASMTAQIWVHDRLIWVPHCRLLLPEQAIAAHVHSIDGMASPLQVFVVSDQLDILIQLPRAPLHAGPSGCIITYHPNFICSPHRFQSNLDLQMFLSHSGDDGDDGCDDKFFEFGGNTHHEAAASTFHQAEILEFEMQLRNSCPFVNRQATAKWYISTVRVLE